MSDQLRPGTRIGAYEVLAKLGAGGMGEVYRAHDTKLGRDVALKVLPDEVASDPERLKRFEREARTLAALNHPHIAQVYGFEDSGAVRALVMELVPGESLAARLVRSPLPIRDALEFAGQIADGLEAAHDKGIIHRDLKPANVQVTPDEQVKVLDFGLAKAAAADVTADISASPTLTAQTGLGVILGTAAYMSPEQARGRPVDARTDIWAFGCVLYECLTGRRAIAGETTTDAIVAILEREPDWAALPAATPSAIRTLLQRCLKKDPRQRLHHIADARFTIEEALAAPGPEGPGLQASATPPRAVWRHPLPLAIAIVAVLSVGALGVLMSGLWAPPWLAQSSSRPRVVRFTIDLPAGRVLRSFAFAPDGSLLAYIGAENDQTRIYTRSLSRSAEGALAGSEGAVSLFFSPDSQWIAFVADGRLRRIPATGGEATSIADVSFSTVDNVTIPSGVWTAGGSILVSMPGLGIFAVPSSGGSLTSITSPTTVEGDQYHLWPEALPPGANILFTVSTAGDYDAARIEAVPTGGGSRKRVLGGVAHPRYLPTGHLLLAERGRLSTVAFDAGTLATAGQPVPVVEGLAYEGKLPLFDVSAAGDLAFAEEVELPTPGFFRVDRLGRAARLDTVVPGLRESLSFAPDGERVAAWMVHRRERRMSIVLIDLRRGVLTHLPLEGSAHVPVWLPDGRSLIYSSDIDGPFNLFVKPADGSGTATRLTSGPVHEDPGSVSRDGRWIAYAVASPKTGADVWSFDNSTRKAAPLRQTPADERNPSLSPDGRWVAYTSNESNREEVYVEAFPQGGGRVQLSAGGGSDPVWSAATQEVFYLKGNTVMSVKVDTSSSLHVGSASRLFEAPPGIAASTYGLPKYAVSPDGQFFYMVRLSGSQPALQRIHVVLNWLDEFTQRMKK